MSGRLRRPRSLSWFDHETGASQPYHDDRLRRVEDNLPYLPECRYRAWDEAGRRLFLRRPALLNGHKNRFAGGR